jgi:LAS superfamily LD-carboxypeptidase LdcB
LIHQICVRQGQELLLIEEHAGDPQFQRNAQVPKDLVTIKKESAPGSGKVVTRGVHYLPKDVHGAYQGMNRAMLRDIGRRVFVESGYRSSAYQCMLFLEYLADDNFNIRETVKRIAFPGYSEHGAPHTQAIDFITEDQENNSTVNPVFETTKEYQWLYSNAPEYGFLLSYPRGNEWGMAFEPWHWHYDAQIIINPRKKGIKK